MLQSLKKISWILLLVSGQQAARAFALLGPIANGGDAWQVPTIGYDYPGTADIGEPKNLGEEYRWNTPVLYYACDANVLDFYGSSGSAAVDQAFTILNNSLTNVDAYSSGLTEFPLNSLAMNYQASALGLLDMKSVTLTAMVEELGLADPIRFVWTLHDRYLPPSAMCPGGEEYLVVQRNFDITASPLNQVQYSSYVDGSLYTYFLMEDCTAPIPPNALTEPVIVDPLNFNAPVAATYDGFLPDGGFYIGLTRDDMAGFRYLLSTNNVIFESPTAGSVLLSSTATGGTNYGSPFALFTTDFTSFALAAQTNSPVILSNLYPGLIITGSSNYFTIVAVPNIVTYFTNLIGAPAGSQTLVIATNGFTYTVVQNYADTFANIVTNTYNPKSSVTVVTVQVQQLTGAPGGILTTNTTTQIITLTNVPSGDFYINTNACGPDLILYPLLTNVVVTTNVLLSASNSTGLFFSQTDLTYATNHIYVAEPVLCGAAATGGTTTNVPGLYQGIGRIQFVKTSFDSLLGQFYQPITNTYSMELVVNHQSVHQTYQRVVTVPDFLFTAADLAPGPDTLLYENFYARTTPNYDEANVPPALAGPGTLNPQVTVTFNKVANRYQNSAGGDELTQAPYRIYGSYDGTTNDPVVYPDGTSIANLANQVLVQISPAALPAGTNGVAYPATSFVATGGPFSPPFTWSLPSGGLPAGLTLSSGGTITGTPAQSGTFDFTLQLTDVLSRSVQWNYTITIQ